MAEYLIFLFFSFISETPSSILQSPYDGFRELVNNLCQMVKGIFEVLAAWTLCLPERGKVRCHKMEIVHQFWHQFAEHVAA